MVAWAAHNKTPQDWTISKAAEWDSPLAGKVALNGCVCRKGPISCCSHVEMGQSGGQRVICYMAFSTWSLYWRMEGSTLERKTKGHSPKGAHSWCRVKSERSSVQLRKWLNRLRRGLVSSQARTKATAQTCWIPLSLPLISTPVQPEGSEPPALFPGGIPSVCTEYWLNPPWISLP